MTEAVKLVKHNNIAIITLNNPKKHNAFDEIIIENLSNILIKLKNNNNIKVIILESNGKSFCAGADLAWMQKMVNFTEQENYQDSKQLANMLNLLYNMPQVTIAKIQGAAYGGGVGLVTCCDIAVASDSAKFCFSEVKLGLIPAVISPYIIRAIGVKQARRYFITAEVINSSRALEINLINEVTSLDNLDEFINKLVNNILNNSSDAMYKSKLLLNDIENKVLDQNLIDFTAKEISRIRVSKDAQNRLNSFLGK